MEEGHDELADQGGGYPAAEHDGHQSRKSEWNTRRSVAELDREGTTGNSTI